MASLEEIEKERDALGVELMALKKEYHSNVDDKRKRRIESAWVIRQGQVQILDWVLNGSTQGKMNLRSTFQIRQNMIRLFCKARDLRRIVECKLSKVPGKICLQKTNELVGKEILLECFYEYQAWTLKWLLGEDNERYPLRW